MSTLLFEKFVAALADTLTMVSSSLLLAVALGLPLALSMALTAPGGMVRAPRFHRIASAIVDGTRATPFIILMVLMIPVTRWLVGSAVGVAAAIVPLTISVTPYFARIAEVSLLQVDKGLIEAAQAMGCERRHVVVHVLLAEALPGIAGAVTITLVALFNLSAMAGVLGAGGLGDLAIRYGFDRYEPTVMAGVVLLLFVLVTATQTAGDRIVNRLRLYR